MENKLDLVGIIPMAAELRYLQGVGPIFWPMGHPDGPNGQVTYKFPMNFIWNELAQY